MSSIITQGMSKTIINDRLVEDKQYMGTYDGKKGKLIMRNGNEGVYVELDNNDLANIFNKKDLGEKNKPIDGKLRSLLKKHRTVKNEVTGRKKKRKTRNKKNKKRKKNRKLQTKKRKRKRKIRSSYKKLITPKNRLF
tara:strand:+ start:44 stop:454 length:411 start_codon:yes stop_codon:yes gene_type:complete